MKSQSFVKILAGVAAVGAFAGVAMRDRSSLEAVEPRWSEDRLLTRGNSDRVLKKASFERVFSVSGAAEKKSDLYNPLILRADAAENIYVVDYGDRRVKKFSPSGKLLATLGKGRGQGPGELNNPTDLVIGTTGDIWVCDPHNGGITIFGADGSLRQTLRLQSRPHRIQLRADGGFLAQPENPSNGLIEEYGPDFKLERRFGQLFSRQGEIAIALDGWIALAPSGDLFYAPLRLGLLASFRNGETRFVAETQENVAMPKVQTSSTGIRRIDPDAPLVQLDLNTVDDTVFLHSVRRQASGKYRAFLDLFGPDGKYRYSIDPPDTGDTMTLTRHSIFSINKGTLSRYTWSLPPA